MVRRNLTGEENDLWQRATRDIKPLSPTAPDEPPTVVTPAAVPPAPPVIPSPVTPALTNPTPVTAPLPQHFDRHGERQLHKGRLPIEARLDLHGLTERHAHRALTNFIERNVAAGKRVLLVVTGKGRLGEGVIRRNLPGWLEAPGLRQHVVACRPSLPKHGGDGAFYIILHRRK